MKSNQISAVDGHTMEKDQRESTVRASVKSQGAEIDSVCLSWQDMSRSIALPKYKDENGVTQHPTKLLLDNVSGVVKPGELVAAMGPSGAGKSSFLDTISGRIPAMAGSTVAVNEHVLQSAVALRGLSAYVPQDDSLMGALTVEETINYSAQLRLSHTKYTAEEREKHVDDIILGLGLDRVRKNIVGTVTTRGISGGEKRRVSIAMELVTRPSILFLDEPTSGLDSAASYACIKMLKKLAKRDQFCVIATIHQPSTKVYDLFDKVMLLAGGKTVYFGTREEMPTHFEGIGYPCPQYANPADYYMDLINTDFVKAEEECEGAECEEMRKLQEQTPVASKELLDELIEKFKTSKTNIELQREIDAARSAEKHSSMKVLEKLRSSKDLKNNKRDVESQETTQSPTAPAVKLVYNNNVFVETMLLTKREFQNAVRNVLVFWARLILYTMLALMMGLAWLQISDFQTHVQDRLSVHFFGLTFLSFGYFIRIDNVPVYFAWAQWIDFFKYGFENSVYNDFDGLTFDCQQITAVTYSCLYQGTGNAVGTFSGQDVLREYGYENVNTGDWMGAMIGIAVVVRIMVFGVLYYKSQPKKL
eukprot:Nk52_evm21s272 gene=Nk52_evmTU21s272